MLDSVPFVMTNTLSKIYYKGLPSNPRLIATTKPDPYKEPTGPEAYSVFKELQELGNHPLASVWDNDLAERLRGCLTAMRVHWTSLDAVRIVEVEQSSTLAIVWIGVEFGALSFEEGSVVAHECRMLIDSYDIPDYHVEIRESRVMRQAGNRLRPWVEGTGGFYLSAGDNDENIYLVTARHVFFPLDEDNNKEYERKDDSMVREDVTVLGIRGFNEKLAAMDYEISGQEHNIVNARERIKYAKGKHEPEWAKEREEAERDLQKAEEGLEALRALRPEITTRWGAKEQRIFGELAWAPPIILSTAPGQYTLDLAIIKINTGTLDAENYRGNSINIGTKYIRYEFMNKVRLHHTSAASFRFPSSRLATLQDQVPEDALVKPPMLDANGDPCLIVFKNGGKSGTTIGRANSVSSYTRTYLAGQYQESREWPIISIDKHRGGFSAKGDSGACVADAFSRVGGIITGGCGADEFSDLTYATPISFIMKVLHSTERFEYAHLNPVLA